MKKTIFRGLASAVVLAATLTAHEPRLVVDGGGYQAQPKLLSFALEVKSPVSAGEDRVVLAQLRRPDSAVTFQIAQSAEPVKTNDPARGAEAVSTKVLGPGDVRSYPPPWIYVIEPEQDAVTVNQNSLPLKAVTHAELPITRFEIWVNGVCQLGCGQVESGKDPNMGRLQGEVDLRPGPNKVDFVSSHAKATSPAREILVDYQPRETEQGRRKLFALTIGVSNYSDPHYHLNWAAKDALDVETLLSGQNDNRLYSQVVTHHIVDVQVTREHILTELSWLSKQGGDRDIRVVFLSGHGGLDNSGNYYFYGVNHDPQRRSGEQ